MHIPLRSSCHSAVSADIPDSDFSYGDLIVKQDKTVYINKGTYENNGGLLALREVSTEEEVKSIGDVVLSALSSIPFQVEENESGISITVDSTEEWSALFSAISTSLGENIDVIVNGYKEKDAAKKLVEDIISATKVASETQTVANTINATIRTETVDDIKKYSGAFDITVDFAALPAFISAEDFDSNQLKITASFEFTVAEASTAKPVGAVYDATPNTISDFIVGLWSSMFSKEAFVPLNNISLSGTTVTSKYDLGEVIEDGQFEFDKNGIVSAKWIITSTNRNIIEAYKKKFNHNEPIIENATEHIYQIVLIASEDALRSLNKLGSTPQAFEAYLKTAKGGDIIV